ncbi:EpsG family protein [uncultured Bacteroides sp.]|uniref:EpsG family protein n=1 Tax=uncultured Bacteroides sp. TaxID=162156 RepID=UPI00262F7A9C|nr:EpsG family protein [uncultured Bacteroides sp.]
MLQSFIVYTSLSIFMIFCGVIASNREQCNSRIGLNLSFFRSETIVPLFVFAIIFGCRYNVGVDYPHYLEGYLYGSDRNMEFLFGLVTNEMSNLGIHYALYFTLWAFVEVFLLFYTFRRQRFLFPYITFYLIFGSYYLSMMNIIRQQLAACVFLFSLQYIDSQKWVKYYLCVLLAFLFHKSALLLLFVYPIFRKEKDWFPTRKFQYLLLLIALYLSMNYNLVVKLISIPFALFTGALGYENYLEGILYNEKLNSVAQFGNNTGLGVYIQVYLSFVMIWYSKRMKAHYADSFFLIIYSLWFVRILADFVVGDSIILNRPFVYVYNLKIVMLAYFTVFCLRTKQKIPLLIACSFILIHIILFLNVLSNGEVNTSMFKFFWQI